MSSLPPGFLGPDFEPSTSAASILSPPPSLAAADVAASSSSSSGSPSASSSSSTTTPLRQLLPANSPDPASRRAFPQLASHKDGPRKSYVLAACEACRRRKSKCSGERPICLVCSRRGSDCQYTTSVSETRGQALKRRYNQLSTADSPHRTLVELLTSISDQQALAILHRLRAGDQPELVLGQLSAGSALLQLAVKPETRYRYVFPVMAEMPPGLVRDNPYLDSVLYEAALLFPSSSSSSPSSASPPMTPPFDTGSPAWARQLSRVHDRREIQSLYVMPYHAAETIIPRLCSVCPSAWTSVCKDDVLMRNLLASFFKNDYNCVAAFHIDYFLEDMATGRTDYCSSLLVNAVLAAACSTYSPFEDRSEYWNPDTLSYKFLAEAKRLWEVEASPSFVVVNEPGRPSPRHLTTLQAGLCITISINITCMDKIGESYTKRALQLAHEIDLFNYGGTYSSKTATDRHTINLAFTAWALYNWDCLCSYHFFVMPAITRPPQWALPDLNEHPRWYGDVALKYPDTASLSPTHFGPALEARCRIRVILNEFCQVYYIKDSLMSAEHIRHNPGRALSIANSFHARIDEWRNQLPSFLTAREIVLPVHIQLHCYYECLIVSIYGPLQSIRTSQSPSPSELVTRAQRHLVTLLRLYFLRHGFESADSWLAQPLVMVANMFMEILQRGNLTAAEQKEAQSSLVLLVKGMRDQSRNNTISELVFRITKARMRAQDQQLLLSEGIIRPSDGEYRTQQMREVQTQWPAMATKMADEPHTQTLSDLLRTMERVNIDEQTDSTAQWEGERR